MAAVCLGLLCLVSPCPARAAAPNPAVGTWLVREQANEVVLALRGDGVFFRTVRAAGQPPSQETGSWTYTPGLLTITTAGGQVMTYQCQFPGPDQMQISDASGQGALMVRVSDAPPPQAPPAQAPPVQPPAPSPGNLPQAAAGPPDPLYLRPYTDQTENAFRVQVPVGWLAKGGILRVNPLTAGGPTNTVAAKTDFAVMSDPTGQWLIRWLPSYTYVDSRYLVGNYLPGSNYRGCQVAPLLSAEAFLLRLAFPYTHRQATDLRVLESRPLPGLAHNYQQRKQLLGSRFRYDAQMVHLAYQERGQWFEEKMFGIIEDTGQLGVGMWSNQETLVLRAPLGQLAAWEPVFWIIHGSMQLNPNWVAGEVRGQIQRGQAAREMQAYEQKTMNEILEHRRKTYADIRKAMYLMMTGQAQYRNPHTGQLEVAPNRLKNRWVNGAGEEAYSNNPDFDPNRVLPGRSDYKLTPEVPPSEE
ncbi:MAG: hypothetical protein KQJ78_17480 [Deltaproteobacteria bacterium]|nr:hypothetical protein [Deltaproteobacteria bacterium]